MYPCQNVSATFQSQQDNSSFVSNSCCLPLPKMDWRFPFSGEECWPLVLSPLSGRVICLFSNLAPVPVTETLLKVRCGGILITCQLCSWSWAGYLGSGCCSCAGSYLGKMASQWIVCGDQGLLWTWGNWVPRVAFLALGLRSANQLLGLFLNSPMSSYFMVLTCPPAPL